MEHCNCKNDPYNTGNRIEFCPIHNEFVYREFVIRSIEKLAESINDLEYKLSTFTTVE